MLPNGTTVTGHKIGIQDFLPTAVHIRDFGAACDGVTDDSAAVQAAVDAVSTLNGDATAPAIVHGDPLNPSLIKETIDLTTSRTGVTKIRDGLVLTGINFIGETGDGNAIIETTGSQHLQIEGQIRSGSSNKSTVGVYQGLSQALAQTQNQRLALRIQMHDDAAANGGIGTVGLWNFGSEENTYLSCYITANRPAILTGHSSGSAYGAYANSVQSPQAGSHSCGMNTFAGETFLVTLGRRAPSLCTEDVNSLHFDNVYMANSGAGGSNNVAWEQRGSMATMRITGVIEGHATAINVYGTIDNLDAKWTFGTITATTEERITLQRGGEGRICESRIHFKDNVSPNRALMDCPIAGLSDIVSSFIRNTEIRVNCEPQYAYIQENVKWNPGTANVTIEALLNTTNALDATYLINPWRYFIGDHQDVMSIPKTTVWQNGSIGSAQIAKFKCPTANGTANALGATVKVKGLVSALTVNGGTNAMSAKYVEEVMQIALAPDGTIYKADADKERFSRLSVATDVNFGSILAGAYEDRNITLTGVLADGNWGIALTVPNAALSATQVIYEAWVSAGDTVTIRCNNTSPSTTINPANGTFTVIAFKIQDDSINVNTGGNAIGAVAITGVISTFDHVSLVMTVTRGGVNNEPLQFTGVIEAFWHGNEARAPRLELP